MSGRESNYSCVPTAEIKCAHSTTLSSRVESSETHTYSAEAPCLITAVRGMRTH